MKQFRRKRAEVGFRSCHSISTISTLPFDNIMAPTKNGTADAKQSYSTTGTVSAPVNLDDLVPKGEHTTVKLNGTHKNIQPKPKVTLTSLTPNNVSAIIALNDPFESPQARSPSDFVVLCHCALFWFSSDVDSLGHCERSTRS